MSNQESWLLKPRPSDFKTHEFRKKVMFHLYEARALDPSIPRVRIRISDPTVKDGRKILGEADLETHEIRISIDPVIPDLRRLVYHELLHTLYYADHDSRCPIMKPSADLEIIPKHICDRAFLSYVTKKSPA